MPDDIDDVEVDPSEYENAKFLPKRHPEIPPDLVLAGFDQKWFRIFRTQTLSRRNTNSHIFGGLS